MRSVKLEIGKLVGYSAVAAGEHNVKKRGSAKLGEKMNKLSEEEKQTASAERASASA